MLNFSISRAQSQPDSLDKENYQTVGPEVATEQKKNINDSPIFGNQKMGNCPDCPGFNSVSVFLTSKKDINIAGKKAEFLGDITNSNDYPIVNLDLWVRIFKHNSEGKSFLVDQFLAKDNLTIQSKEEQKFSFLYSIPVSFPKGKYTATAFLTAAKTYHFQKVGFIDTFTLGVAGFEIQSPGQELVYLDQDQVKVNDEELKIGTSSDGQINQIEENSDVKINFQVVNRRNTREDFKLTYSLYNWDTINPSNLIREETEKITLNHQETKELQYLIPKVSPGAYKLKITAKSGTVQSMLEIPFITKEFKRSKLQFSGISKFPVNQGDKIQMFACFRNVGKGEFEGTVETTLKDEKNKIVAKDIYTGPITDVLKETKKEIVSSENYGYLTLTAVIKDKNGKVIDKAVTTYGERAKPVFSEPQAEKNRLIILLSILASTAVLGALIIYLIRAKR